MRSEPLRTARAIVDTLPLDKGGHVTDCGYTFANPECECALLPARIAELLHAHRVSDQAVIDALRARLVRAEELRAVASKTVHGRIGLADDLRGVLAGEAIE